MLILSVSAIVCLSSPSSNSLAVCSNYQFDKTRAPKYTNEETRKTGSKQHTFFPAFLPSSCLGLCNPLNSYQIPNHKSALASWCLEFVICDLEFHYSSSQPNNQTFQERPRRQLAESL